MCGIFGVFRRDGATIDPSILSAMGSRIQHRGPDDRGVVSRPGIALGNQRLSIIDISGGHQPFMSDDGLIAVVQNGEIFNYKELAQELAAAGNPCRTKSDTEVLLRLYELEGIGFLHKLNGMFAVAIWDQRIGKLHLVRDRIGVKPLFIHDRPNQLTFGSEIKALLPAIGDPPPPNLEAIHHYLTFNYVPPPHTMFQGVSHVMPGHRMEIDAGGVVQTRWWDLADQVADVEPAESDTIEEFNALIDDAVRLRMRCDVPFGAFLSGGVDSSTVVALMARHAREPVKTFCIGFDDPRFDESPFAQTAAERFGTEHVTEIVDPDMLEFWQAAIYFCDQPHGDVSFLPTHRVASLAARDVKVVLTGDGGDELFAGYDKYLNFFGQGDCFTISDEKFRRSYFDSISLFDLPSKARLYSPTMQRACAGLDSFDEVKPWFERASHQDRINQALYVDMELLLSGNNLVKPDRMGMAVSLEARTPFLDYRMMEFAFRIPGSMKLRGGETKYIYKQAVSNLIGRDLAFRKKQMFTVPVGNWFKTHLRQYCQKHFDYLLDRTELFQRPALQNLLDTHQSGAANNTREIRALIALSLWYAKFQDQGFASRG